ncbi:hypothetical protein [Hansschlegelia zhihuaiae]|uniref:Uncharacterized protein n=1 Tax=Hansschlegelia zhihuaiae TaxID=405005 RepID=A0A4Q0MAZ8_9HYPH|nr:hypothetical protein [Hansschlegelia zhihuaiae]RXF69989.1 hypothetical protein EK403_17850 [Hansschlegelia zhihuaiae]
MSNRVIVSCQVRGAFAGYGEIWTVQISIRGRVSRESRVLRGIGCADAPTVEEAEAEAWADAISDFCSEAQRAGLLDAEIDFEVEGPVFDWVTASHELNQAWRAAAKEKRT